MIPNDTITTWSVSHPWPTREQVEQDLLLSKAICDIFNNKKLASELIFRGGTALNKLLLKRPYRYSEDLDFVRTNSGGIGELMKELTKVGQKAGYQIKTKMGLYPKLFWLTTSQTGYDLKIKIEINTYERASALPTVRIKHSVETNWYSGAAFVKTYQAEEIAATKLRALYQRSKGRDLFDLWLLSKEIGVDASKVCHSFSSYHPLGYTRKKAIENLERKLQDSGFRHDLTNLLSAEMAKTYNQEEAARIITERYLQKL